MVTGREIEVMSARREQLLKEADDYRRVVALEDRPDERTHILAAVGVSLVRVGYALQSRFSDDGETETFRIGSLDGYLMPGTPEGC